MLKTRPLKKLNMGFLRQFSPPLSLSFSLSTFWFFGSVTIIIFIVIDIEVILALSYLNVFGFDVQHYQQRSSGSHTSLLTGISLACRKLGDPPVRHSIRRGTEFFVQVRRKQQPGKGVGLVVKESICPKPVYTHDFIDERLMSTRFELAGKCEAVNFVVAYTPSDCTKHPELKNMFWQKLEDLVEQTPTRECLLEYSD